PDQPVAPEEFAATIGDVPAGADATTAPASATAPAQPSTIAAWAAGDVGDSEYEGAPFAPPPDEAGFAAAALPADQEHPWTAALAEPPDHAPHDDWLVEDPWPAPAPEPAPTEHTEAAEPAELSLNELLAEDLPIPEAVTPPTTEKETTRIWLRDLLDEELSIPDPAAVAGGTQETVPEPEQDYVPPPPSRLLTNLFEPDPDDPLVQSLRAREEQDDPRES
ncbi:MAG: hypothetical protein ACRD2W_10190, partial [Acidimicrobiales bacterium]